MLKNIPPRFRRTALLTGTAGLDRLTCEKIAVIGLGGLGSYTVEALARAGVGWLILVDYDVIRPEDTNRELQAMEGFYGQPKVTALAERVKAINPEIAVVTWQEYIRRESLDTILHGRISYVIDATNSLPAQVTLIRYCREREIPLITAADTGNRLDPSQLRIGDLKQAETIESIQSLRTALGKYNIFSGVKLLYSTETPRPVSTEPPGCPSGCDGCGFSSGDCNCPNRSNTINPCCRSRFESGSLSYLPPIAGFMLAGQALRDLLQI